MHLALFALCTFCAGWCSAFAVASYVNGHRRGLVVTHAACAAWCAAMAVLNLVCL